MTLAAVLCCGLMFFSSCKNENPPDEEGDITGNWYGDVTGKTYAPWNYGSVWQNTVFNADGTGRTEIYFFFDDILLAREDDDFTYTTANDVLTMVLNENKKTIQTHFTIQDGQLKLEDEVMTLSLVKTTEEMGKNFEKWSRKDSVIAVPQPCKHTVFVYGNASGGMDDVIETGFWELGKQFITDSANVRVICMYKFGKDEEEAPKYGNPRDVVWFELNSQTDLTKIKDEGLQSLGLTKEAQELKLCNPNIVRFFIEVSSLICPAEQYSFAIWGHGSGFSPRSDVPGKYNLAHPAPHRAPKGVIYDEWNNDEELDMYEFAAAIEATGIKKFNTIYFHNCLMGNLETLTQIRHYADYLAVSAHILSSDGYILSAFINGLIEEGDAVKAAQWMFDKVEDLWKQGYPGMNGDFKLLRADKLDAVLAVVKRLSDRLISLYPTKKEQIDEATSAVYGFVYKTNSPPVNNPFYDIANYAQALKETTQDEEFGAISADLDKAFNEAISVCRDVNYSPSVTLEHYTLSVCLVTKDDYNANYLPSDSYVSNFNTGYEQSDFHKLTGWGNWLNTNEQSLADNPRCGD